LHANRKIRLSAPTKEKNSRRSLSIPLNSILTLRVRILVLKFKFEELTPLSINFRYGELGPTCYHSRQLCLGGGPLHKEWQDGRGAYHRLLWWPRVAHQDSRQILQSEPSSLHEGTVSFYVCRQKLNAFYLSACFLDCERQIARACGSDQVEVLEGHLGCLVYICKEGRIPSAVW